jgi:hypothetical protein
LESQDEGQRLAKESERLLEIRHMQKRRDLENLDHMSAVEGSDLRWHSA